MRRGIQQIPATENPPGPGPDLPTIAQEFRRGNGWVRQTHRKQVSAAWLRKLRREGVTHVTLKCDGRTTDFSIEDLLASARKGNTK